MRERIQLIIHRFSNWLESLTWPHLTMGFTLAIILAIVGQIFLVSKLEVLGICSYFLAGILFLAIMNLARTRPEPEEQETARIRRSVPAFLTGLTSLALVAFVLPRLEDYVSNSWQNYLTLIGWLLSLVFFSVTVLILSHWRPVSFRLLAESLRSNAWEAAFVACLFIAALGLRIYQLDKYPYPMLKDEALMGVEALKIIHGDETNLFLFGWAGDPRLSSTPQVITIGLLGNTLFAIRLASAIVGALSILFLYFLARAMFGRFAGVLASLCLLAMPPHLHFSRLGVNNIIVSLWMALIFWLTYRAIQKGRSVDYLWAGLVTGLPLYSYLGSRLVSVMAVLMLVHAILTQRGYLRSQWRNLIIFGLALTFVVTPTLVYMVRHPELFITRFRADNIFTTHWLISEPIISGRSIPAALLDQFSKSTLVFISSSAWGGFYYSPYPYLPLVGAIFMVLGFAYSLSHLRDVRYLLLQAWFWASVILGSVLFSGAPSTEKLVGTLPAAALFVAIGLVQVVDFLKHMRLFSPKLVNGLAAGLVLLTSLQGAIFYLGEYQQQRFFAHPYEEFETEVSQFVSFLGPGKRLYLLVTLPLEAKYFPAHDYLIPEVPVQDLAAITPEEIGALPRNQELVFVSIPERKADLDEVARLLPGGKWREVARQPVPGQPDQMLYYAYWLEPAQAAKP